MTLKKIFIWLFILVCLLFLVAGCGSSARKPAEPKVAVEEPKPEPAKPEVPIEKPKPEPAKPKAVKEKPAPQVPPKDAITLAIKPPAGQTTKYKVVEEARRSINWEGPLPDKSAFEEKYNQSRVEVTFTQKIMSVDSEGSAKAQITIDGLKYSSIMKNNTVVEFDSSAQEDSNHPMANLIGKSYVIGIKPDNKIPLITGLADVLASVSGGSTASKAARGIVSTKAIRERHGRFALPGTGKNQLQAGDKWSSVKAFSFDMMGAQAFERIYTLKEVQQAEGRKIVVIEMDSIPSSEMPKEFRKEQGTGDFAKAFDNTTTYTGELQLDLDAGRAEKCVETLQSQWITALPSSKEQESNEPVILKMASTRFYSLERIDN